jgi:hypothetical protein
MTDGIGLLETFDKMLYSHEINIEAILDLFCVLDLFTNIKVTKKGIIDKNGDEHLIVTDIELEKIDITEEILVLAMENKKACNEIFAKDDQERAEKGLELMPNEDRIEFRRKRLENIIKKLS